MFCNPVDTTMCDQIMKVIEKMKMKRKMKREEALC